MLARSLCLVTATLLLAGSAEAQRAGKRAKAKPKAAYHAVKIRQPLKPVRIAPKVHKLAFIKSLKADNAALKRGLTDYRSVRLRIRDLRKTSPHLEVRPLIKTKSFIVDKLVLKSAKTTTTKPKILIVGGVHAGSETIGVEAALQVAEHLGKNPAILEHFDITIIPLVNPTGLMRGDATKSKNGTPGRYTSDGVDINRSFGAGRWTPESKAMADLMKTERFHAILDLHGAGSHRDGFFIIKGTDDGGIASRFTSQAQGVPLLTREGAGTTYNFNTPGVVTSSNEGTLKQFGVSIGTRHSYTFEAPGKLSAEKQIAGTLSLVNSALNALRP